MGARLILHPFDVLLNFLRVGLMLCNVGIYRFYHPKPTKNAERESGRITLDVVEDEINRLRYNWQESRPSALTALLGAEAENIDLFDRMQLEHVIAICRQAKSLSAERRWLRS